MQIKINYLPTTKVSNKARDKSRIFIRGRMFLQTNWFESNPHDLKCRGNIQSYIKLIYLHCYLQKNFIYKMTQSKLLYYFAGGAKRGPERFFKSLFFKRFTFTKHRLH